MGGIMQEAGKSARTKMADFVTTQLLDAAAAAAGRALRPDERRAVLATAGIVVDLTFYIMDEVSSGKPPTVMSVVKYKMKQAKRLGAMTEANTLLCMTAVVDLAFKLVTLYPAMVAAGNAAVVATGMAPALGGAGFLFAAGAWGTVGIAGLLLYLSASDVGLRCETMASERWASGAIPGAGPLKPALSLPLQTELVFVNLRTLSNQGPRCEANARF